MSPQTRFLTAEGVRPVVQPEQMRIRQVGAWISWVFGH